jgi:DNA-binding LytR/AlgR family response regulator
MKILVVEDDPLAADNLVRILHELDYSQIVRAHSYETALEAIGKDLPDLALIDIGLKGELTGIDLGKRLGQMGVHHMYLTGQQDPGTFLRASQTAPLRNLPKPITRLMLRNALLETDPLRKPLETPVVYLINDGDRNKIRIEPQNIVYALADGSYTHLYCVEHDITRLVKHTLTMNLKNFLERLDWPDILKIHRSHAINVHHIVGTPQGNRVEMKGDVRLDVAPNAREQLARYLKSI